MLHALALFSAKIDEREAKLIAMLAEQARTLTELVACRLLYPPGYEEIWIDDAERRSISQHLDELTARGVVAEDDEHRYRLR
jgi:DNA-binding transcriptional ArsR family regulator